MNARPPRVRILKGDLHLVDLRTRMPFRYGIAVMTHTPHAFLRLQVEVDGRPARGIAADHLPPRWFTKDPSQSPEDEVAGMLRVIEKALELAAGLEGESAFQVWLDLYRAQARWGRSEGLAPLLTGFGASLVERALIEAVCRTEGRPFARVLRENRLGIRLEAVHPALGGREPADLLPGTPLPRITARHTVGLADPLAESDIGPEERLADGLPQSLEAAIRAYGLRHFKVKLEGNLMRDFERLVRVQEVLRSAAPADHALTLDANEQFRSPAGFREYWEGLSGIALLSKLLDRVLFIEQPIHRDAALSPEVGEQLREWPDRPPLIIDESDGALESVQEALRLGYAGGSHKNSKGVLKGIANACLIEKLRRERPGSKLILSGEDLANIGPVALLQDLAVCASLGIGSVERNGHHYFAGLSMFPEPVQRQALEAHPDLYRRAPAGWPALDVREGTLALGSVLDAPFGVGFELDVERFTPVSVWRARRSGR